jgi:putative N-acetyltransferase (TIGR04045 family)
MTPVPRASHFVRSSAPTDRPPARTSVPRCRLVATVEELDLDLRIREQVFVREQCVFPITDRDTIDDAPDIVHVLGTCDGVAAGTVRLYPLDGAGLWKGDRLAVLPQFRSCGLGAPLVRFAVRTAAERGGVRMQAFVQPANISFFRRLGWRAIGTLVDYCGRPHQEMTIDLDAALCGGGRSHG